MSTVATHSAEASMVPCNELAHTVENSLKYALNVNSEKMDRVEDITTMVELLGKTLCKGIMEQEADVNCEDYSGCTHKTIRIFQQAHDMVVRAVGQWLDQG